MINDLVKVTWLKKQSWIPPVSKRMLSDYIKEATKLGFWVMAASEDTRDLSQSLSSLIMAVRIFLFAMSVSSGSLTFSN